MLSIITTLSILVKFCIWVLDFYNLETLGAFVISLQFALWIVANLQCFSLCLFDAIVDLHLLDWKSV